MTTTKQLTVEEMAKKLNELKDKNGRETDYAYKIEYYRYSANYMDARACTLYLEDTNGKVYLGAQFDEKNGLGGIEMTNDINDKVSNEEKALINRIPNIFEFDMDIDFDRSQLFGEPKD